MNKSPDSDNIGTTICKHEQQLRPRCTELQNVSKGCDVRHCFNGVAYLMFTGAQPAHKWFLSLSFFKFQAMFLPSNGLQPRSNGLRPTSDGLQPTSDGLQPAHKWLLSVSFCKAFHHPCKPCAPRLRFPAYPVEQPRQFRDKAQIVRPQLTVSAKVKLTSFSEAITEPFAKKCQSCRFSKLRERGSLASQHAGKNGAHRYEVNLAGMVILDHPAAAAAND